MISSAAHIHHVYTFCVVSSEATLLRLRPARDVHGLISNILETDLRFSTGPFAPYIMSHLIQITIEPHPKIKAGMGAIIPTVPA